MASLQLGKKFMLCGLVLVACSGSSDDPPAPVQILDSQVRIDAGAITGILRPMWGDHYDLSYTHFNYPGEPGFSQVVADLQMRSFRCSIGRWEIGFPPPAGGDSLVPAVLSQIDREFYRGPNTLLGADDPNNYNFVYLDNLLQNLQAAGADPYLCFDYMPFTLAAEQDPNNAFNANVTEPGTPYSTYSFSNGIRTSPPADPLVYARVIRNVMRHTRGLFAGSVDFGLSYFEIGNEPDAVDIAGDPINYFWTGDEAQFFSTYEAIAAEIDGDAQLSGSVLLGAGSFAFLPSIPGAAFIQAFLARIAMNATRLDYLSFHSYGDTVANHLSKFLLVQSFMMTQGLSKPWVNGEWGRELDGTEPTYDRIEHGILRAKVLILMQVFPFVIGHEALLRDPGTSGGELGLIRTGPPAHKPVGFVYQALNKFNDSLNALDVVENLDDLMVLTGRNAASTKVLAAVVVDDPGVGFARRIQWAIDDLPWGAGDYSMKLFRVTQGSFDAGMGIETVLDEVRSGGGLDVSWEVAAGAQGLYLVELNSL